VMGDGNVKAPPNGLIGSLLFLITTSRLS